MGVQIKNNAFSTLSTNLGSSATTINVAAGEGARFPTASTGSGTYFYATLLDTSNNIEIVKVTDRSTDTLTVVRGQDNTTARAFLSGDRIELRVTSALLNDLPIRELETADYADSSVTSAKLAATGVISNTYGGLGKSVTATINSKGQITAASQTNGYVQRNQFDYTSSGASQSWTKPTGAGALVRVQMWGGGGGGARGTGTEGGGGGGGGGYIERWFSIDEIGSGTVVVGGGGAGSVVDNAEGTNGENTTFTDGSVTMTAYAGGGGSANGTTTPYAAGGGGGGELEAGTRASNSTAGKGGAIGGGHGGLRNSGETTATSTARGESAGVEQGDIPTAAAIITNDARSIWGGGGGGGGNNGNVTGSESTGGYAVWGGGGGGGGYNGTQANDGSRGGISVFGGSGGNGSTGNSTPGSNGATPGGGGGGAENSAAGSGGNGRCIITVY